MLRVTLVSIALLATTNIPVSYAEKISTTKCDAPQAINETKTQGGKTYKCTSKTVCRTTSCEVGGSAACTVTTDTNYDCAEVAASGPRGNLGSGEAGGGAGVLDPGPRTTRPHRVVDPFGGRAVQRD